MSIRKIDPSELDSDLFMSFLECEVRRVKTETYAIENAGTMIFMPDIERFAISSHGRIHYGKTVNGNAESTAKAFLDE